MIEDDAIDRLVRGIIKIASKAIKEARFNKGLTGRVMEPIDDNNYIILINNKAYKAKSRFKLEKDDVVKIISWNNDMNELYVIYWFWFIVCWYDCSNVWNEVNYGLK